VERIPGGRINVATVPCSSAASCTAAAATRPPCWPRWPGGG